jgi:hypothetical protein
VTDFAVFKFQISNNEIPKSLVPPNSVNIIEKEHSTSQRCKWAMVTEHQLGTQTILQLACTLQGEQMTFVAKQETKSCSK